MEQIRTDNEAPRLACPQCGSALEFQPRANALVCTHCAHREPIRPAGAAHQENDFRAALARARAAQPTTATLAVHCGACAARFELEPDLHADACPFCGSPVVVDPSPHRHIPAQALLPFAVDATAAAERYRQWLARRWFAPGDLARNARRERPLVGIYTPYWTYDCDTQTTYRGARGTLYHVPVQERLPGRSGTRVRMVTKVSWSPVRGQVRRRFDDLLVLASRSLPAPIAEQLAPWDLDQLVPYTASYLSGFRSELYAIDLANGFDVARAKMRPVIDADVRRDIGGDRQQVSHARTEYGAIAFKHVLLPIWVAVFRYRGKSFRFVVNGRTGEVQGERPYSVWKIALASLALAGVLAGLVWLAEHG